MRTLAILRFRASILSLILMLSARSETSDHHGYTVMKYTYCLCLNCSYDTMR